MSLQEFEAEQSGDLARFRSEARLWLEESFPVALAQDPKLQQVEAHGPANTNPDYLLWKSRMVEKGWTVPTWPIVYGGGGLTQAEAKVLSEELQRIGAASPVVGMGVGLLGPTLLEFADEVQKRRHLPPAARGETRWCQGFSEPGAGSDLASLQCKAEDRGDHFLVNGQKIWTSGAQFADWCFCLVRTDRARKQEGISFLLIDMRTPGIEVRPIELIFGRSIFNEVFFTDVAVPKENLVGNLNGGWAIAKRLLQIERAGAGQLRRGGRNRSLPEMAKRYVGTTTDGQLADRDLRARIAAHEIDVHAVAATRKRLVEEAKAGFGGGAATSIMKNANVAAMQNRLELMIEILAYRGLGWSGEDFAQSELNTVRNWLAGKSDSIWGGTAEIQRNIVSKRILGLPELTQRR